MGLTRSINVLVVGAAFVFVVTMLFIWRRTITADNRTPESKQNSLFHL